MCLSGCQRRILLILLTISLDFYCNYAHQVHDVFKHRDQNIDFHLDLVILVAEACTSITSCLYRYNAIGGKTCSLALQLLSRLTYKMSRDTTLAIVECMELNYHDADLHRSCHQMLTKYAINVCTL
jgi:hypothetical protein